jgi:hypothetical protein
MPAPQINDVIENLADNAFDFFYNSLELIEDDPKRSIIEYYLGLELFFKVRLMSEHWTLIANKPGETALDQFLIGNFNSVGVEQANKRILNIANDGASKEAMKCFEGIKKHRNKLVHFYHKDLDIGELKEDIVTEQIRGWYYLFQLLDEQWSEIFEPFTYDLNLITNRVSKNKQYLKEKFTQVSDELKEFTDTKFHVNKCPLCSYESLILLSSFKHKKHLHGYCKVCNHQSDAFELECPKCKENIILTDSDTACPACNLKFESVQQILIENEIIYEYAEEVDCTQCGESDSIFKLNNSENYLCISCFNFYDHIFECDVCGHTSAEESKFSSGCELCNETNDFLE